MSPRAGPRTLPPEEGETTGNEPRAPKPCPTGGAGTASQCCVSGQGAGVLAIPLLQTRVNRPRWGFPGSAVLKPPRSHHRGHRFDPPSGKSPHAAWHSQNSRGDGEPKLSATAESRARTARTPPRSQGECTLETPHPVSVSTASLTSLIWVLLTIRSRRRQAASRHSPGTSSRAAQQRQGAEPRLCAALAGWPEALLGTGGKAPLPVGLHRRSAGRRHDRFAPGLAEGREQLSPLKLQFHSAIVHSRSFTGLKLKNTDKHE